MIKKILISLVGFTLSWAANADTLTLKQSAPKTYVVKKGDTLWDISGIFLKQPWLWPKLWRMNPDINNPHLIYPGDILRLVFDEQGNPILVKEKRKIKLSPKTRKTMKDQNPLISLPFSIIAPYLRYDNVFTAEQLDNMPYVLGSDEGHKSSLDNYKIYVNQDLEVGKAYATYNKGDAIVDPETEQVIGYYVKLTSAGTAIKTGDMSVKKPSTILVEDIKREVRSGDYVAPVHQQQEFPAFYTMQAANKNLNAKIINASSGNREFSKFEVIMINQGADVLNLGDVVSINRKSPAVVEGANGPEYVAQTSHWNRLTSKNEESAYDMPVETIGQAMVFKTYDKVSMALILTTEKPARVNDIIAAP